MAGVPIENKLSKSRVLTDEEIESEVKKAFVEIEAAKSQEIVNNIKNGGING